MGVEQVGHQPQWNVSRDGVVGDLQKDGDSTCPRTHPSMLGRSLFISKRLVRSHITREASTLPHLPGLCLSHPRSLPGQTSQGFLATKFPSDFPEVLAFSM